MTAKSIHFHSVGQTYHNFKVTKSLDIPELHCTLIELIHEPTGAQVMHIANDDPENLFCLSVRTIPDTSNGVAHILEHTVLCGSEKFPVKDPFFAMQRRSLNTFMNALTGADFTCYPAASQVSKDFYNLLNVYIDAVFRPNLDPLSFLQEGHRLEFSNPADPTSPLEFKGIVFNEMKGAMAGSSARLNEVISKVLFPDLTYGINSGGDPKSIPDLTYEELVEFHKTYYHPSRCLFFFYGNLPLEGHLDYIAENILNGVAAVEQLPPLPLQTRFTVPKHIVEKYPIAEEEDTRDKTQIAFGWLTCNILEQEELLALSILEIILMDTDASPLKMAILKSGLCKQVSAYMEAEISEIPYIIVIRGCKAEDADELEKLIRTTLTEIINRGIPLNQVENAIHQLEFYRSEITGDHAPFGLSLFMRSALLKQHGGEAESGLKIHSLFDIIHRRNLEDPQYLTNLIKKHILENNHFVRVTLIPDKELAAKELEDEKKVLAKIQSELTPVEQQEIMNKAVELMAFQQRQEEEDPDILPKLTLDDVPRAARMFKLTNEKIGKLNVYHHDTFTNEIVYADLIFDLPHIPEEDLPYVRFFTTLMSQMGCNGRGYAENLEYIQANTGGIGASLTFNLQATDHNRFSPSFYIRGKALHRKMGKLFTLIHETATAFHVDDIPRLREIIHKQYIALESSINQNALRYAINLSASGLDVASKIANAWYGLEYYWLIKDLAENFDAKAEWIVSKLKELQKTILCTANPDVVITCSARTYDEIKGHRFYGLQDIETHPFQRWQGNYPLVAAPSQGRIISSPIAFIGKVLKTVSYVHPHAPGLNISSFLFDNVTLHNKLREQGGAYGGGAVSNAMSGNFYFYSYRDPNILSTIEAFNSSIQEILKGKFDDVDLEEAKLEMIQTLDTPTSPGSRGDVAYGWLREGKTPEIRQHFRNSILALTRKDIIKAVEEELVPNIVNATTVVFAGRELLEKENAKLIAHGQSPLPIDTI